MSNTERNAQIVRRYLDGESGAAIGRDLDLTRQAVSQIIRAGTTQRQRDARDRRVARAAEQAREKATREANRGRRCPVCSAPLARGRRVTCSPECAEAWAAGARFKTPEAAAEQRLRVAATTLKYPDRYDPAKVKWAEGVIARGGAPARAA